MRSFRPGSFHTVLPLLAVVGIGLLATKSAAQSGSGSIHVEMTDTASGAALSGRALVIAPSKSMRLDASGLGTWSAIRAGTYMLRCQHPGYTSITRRVVVRAGATARVSCPMSRKLKLDRDEKEKKRADKPSADRPMPAKLRAKGEVGVLGGGRASMPTRSSSARSQRRPVSMAPRPFPRPGPLVVTQPEEPLSREDYKHISENPYHSPTATPLSTFSIDVDTASYSNVRRFLNTGTMPPVDAVKIEELINYFSYSDPAPRGETPFAVTTEVSKAPWNTEHQLVRIGIKGREVATDKLPASNLVFLMDVSGSMNSTDKLPLLKAAFRLLVNNLRPRDRVAIVVYAGAAGTVLPSTSGAQKAKILAAIEKLSAGGSTAGGAGIELAYSIAAENFIKGGNNRVILATDGDFNVGTSSQGDLTRLIQKKRKSGVFLTVLGFGSGNYQDSKMEQLADKGNGNHAYIDSILEAKKVLVTEMGGTLLTIAKDVKLQVEFNPSQVKAYRLIGYENRTLAARDFNDDKKDAGELGAGHSISALYEIIPAGSDEKVSGVDELKYQKRAIKSESEGELMTVKLRYKAPHGDKSKLLSHVVENRARPLASASANLRWASAVAEFGMLLRKSERKGNASYEQVMRRAKEAMGEDPEGYRHEFLAMVKQAQNLSPSR